MDTPLRSSSVPVGKRRHLDYPSPGKDQLLANLLIDFPTSDFPPFLKPILEILIDTRDELHALKDVCSRVSQENETLRAENIRLKQLLDARDVQPNSNVLVSTSPIPTQTQSAAANTLYANEQELERARSIVVSGVVESTSLSCSERASHDLKFIHSILDHLNVECLPVSVYRLGKPDVNNSRLIKVVLPSSKFQQMAVRRAPRLRSFLRKGIYLRPSLTKEERDRLREARRAKFNSKAQNNVLSSMSISPDNPAPSSNGLPPSNALNSQAVVTAPNRTQGNS